MLIIAIICAIIIPSEILYNKCLKSDLAIIFDLDFIRFGCYFIITAILLIYLTFINIII